MMVSEDEVAMRRQVPVLNIAQDPFGVSADSIPDDSENNHEQALAVTSSVLIQRWCTPTHSVCVGSHLCGCRGCRGHQDHPQTRPTRPSYPVNRRATLCAGVLECRPIIRRQKGWPVSVPRRRRSKGPGTRGVGHRRSLPLKGPFLRSSSSAKGTNHYLQLYLPTYIWPAHLDMMYANRNNFNWFGLLPSSTAASVATRATDTFTSGYNQSALWSIPWAAIMGEHDVGGGNFLCGVSEATLQSTFSIAAAAPPKGKHHNMSTNPRQNKIQGGLCQTRTTSNG
ncbi:hypothetical protein, variant 2 [Aphanomyces astaci]|uniref:Uncharacterized protein n=1 Tax=Aphanomyces astaci TaxID=112090 RepID=W4GSE4_APHAT|nr:hypothetical protein, variant 2 [Aphanomyces astaci]ETV82607.1 hypothetical protein, variant 2 [Aphanomyces astaci]|eukprot:XP_009828276.1 hypothetical protein, variant 2 [Aphanomyces astaci]